ncbi:MAG: DUF5011 domain-containing protein [Streptococcaceae bacterium]|jgi:uncharacterized protein YkwD|nr:DUF5011 domain-containing protein [Streptococcaceae bacterium]
MKKNKNPQITNFRSWKSGKSWLYAAGLSITMVGGLATVTRASADSTSGGVTTELQLASLATTAAIVSSQAAPSVSTVASASSVSVALSSNSLQSAYQKFDLVLAQATTLATTSVTSSAVAVTSTAATTSSSLSALNVSSLASEVGSAYNTTLGSFVSNTVSTIGVVNVINQITNLVSQAAPYLASVPGATGITSTITGVVSGVKNVLQMASVLGLSPDVINNMVASVINGGINTIGTMLQSGLSPILQQIPLIGAPIVNLLNPILSNLSGISPASLVASLANAAGLTSVLDGLSGLINTLEPGVVAGLQGVVDTLTGVYNMVNSIVTPIGGFISGLFAPVQNLLSGVISTIQSALGLGGTTSSTASSATSSATSSTNSTTSSVASSASSATSSSAASSQASNVMVVGNTIITRNSIWKATDNFVLATTDGTNVSLADISVAGKVNTKIPGTYAVTYTFKDKYNKAFITTATVSVVNLGDPSLDSGTFLNVRHTTADDNTAGSVITKNTIVLRNSTWAASANLVSATSSTGSPVATTDMYTVGKVLTTIPGTYNVVYFFTDAATGKVIKNTAAITVLQETDSASALANAQLAKSQASAAITSDTAAIASLNNQLANLTGVQSDPTTTFTSTTNYPSVQTVTVPAVAGSFTPDLAKINTYFLQYLNELKTANGQATVSYSASEQAFAQQRAQAIVASFSHDGSNGSTENIGASGNIISTFKSDQEIAYYMLMDWYDETSNPEALGAGHYGHRANLIYGGPSVGIGYLSLATPDSGGFDEYHAMEAPQYTNATLYNAAVAMSNSTTDPQSIPLPKVLFNYVDSATYNNLTSQIEAMTADLAANQAKLAAANSTLSAL